MRFYSKIKTVTLDNVLIATH